MAKLYDMFAELLQAIFDTISLQDLMSCHLVCRRFHAIIRDSPLLQYHVALQASCLREPSAPGQNELIFEKLSRLQAHEFAWRRLDLVPGKRIHLPAPEVEIKFPISGNIFMSGWGGFCGSVPIPDRNPDGSQPSEPAALNIKGDMFTLGVAFSEDQDLVAPICA